MNNKLFHLFGIVLVMCIFSSQNLYSQYRTPEYNLFTWNDNSSVLNTPELKNAVADAVVFTVNRDELINLFETKNPQITLNVPYSSTRSARLDLKRLDILAPDAKIIERRASGNVEVKVEDLAVSYYGTVDGIANSFVTITFAKDDITGLMSIDHENVILGSLKDRSGNHTDDYIVYKESDLKIRNTLHCETEENVSPEYVEKMRQTIMADMNDQMLATDNYVAEIALEIDFITYNIFQQSTVNTTNYAMTVMAGVSALYMKEVNVKLIVPYIRIWTTTDPYNGTTSLELLNQFRGEWLANQQSVNRTVAHFITKRPDNLGGIAWINGLCNSTVSGFGFGFSNTIGGLAQLPAYSYEILVVAHELGHNFGSLHTFNCSWVGGPIDTCFQPEGGCYNGPLHAAVGTIMSYCFNNGSVSFVLGFGPQPRAVIRNGAEAAPCMYVNSRPLEVAFPNGGEIYRTGNSVPIYWGSSLTGNVNIELSTNNGSTWQTIQNNVNAQTRTYNWTVPYVSTAIQSKIRIIDSSNPNVGDTTNNSFSIILNLNTFSSVSPPSLTRIEVGPSLTETQRFAWRSAGTNPTITYKLKLRKLGTTIDYVFPANNNGSDTAVDVRKSLLDSVAATMGTTGDSVRCSWRAWGYNGYDSSASDNSLILTLVRTSVGINVTSTNVPEKFSLENNYPNPFNPSTKIKFDIAKLTFTELAIYDASGREVGMLVNENLSPGSYEFTFDASNLPSGAYFYRLKTAEFAETKRMILVK